MIDVVGGTYFETCRSPRCRQFYGSGGRAAVALSQVTDVCLHTYETAASAKHLDGLANRSLIEIVRRGGEQALHFDYPHGMHHPRVTPAPTLIRQMPPIKVKGSLVLAFGMIEGRADVDADVAVYDPQSESHPIPFQCLGRAGRLAIIGNTVEILRLGQAQEISAAAEALLREGAEVVVVKRGPAGAAVFHRDGTSTVPAYLSSNVFPIGSGDVFSAAFTWFWGHEKLPATDAARYASQCVCSYMESRSPQVLPVATLSAASFVEVSAKLGQVYLAGPFFTMAELRVVEEARDILKNLGVKVFSPYHDIGLGGQEVAKKDLIGLDLSDRVLAILDGCDPGTIFEVGYAVASKKPVIVYCENVPADRLTMIKGTDCLVVSDFATSLYRTVWGC